ncbi:MAG: phenylacetate--CoA ligase [Clostridia bacterium]|nr:phenylacetate--CoA ligase [Clostridia bacterium]
MKYYNKLMECADRDVMMGLQSERLIALVNRVYQNVPFYKQKLDQKGVDPATFTGLDEITKLPFTTKKDLRDQYPFGLFAVPTTDIVRLHASSGTTGKPTVVGYTQNDIDVWAEVMARSLVSAKVNKDDIVQISYGYGLFTGGMGAHLGSEKLGAITVPASTGNTQRQLMLMKDFGTTAVCCTPSYAIVMAEQMVKEGYNIEDFKLRSGIFGAEPWDDKMRADIEKRLNIEAFDIYGLSEIMGPGVGIECEAHAGLHIQDDHFLAEIIDPETLQPLPDGEIGELVITTLTKEGIPLIRYRTGDLTSITHEKCKCGRTTTRIGRITGRVDDMLIIRGVNVFPSQVQTVLAKFNELSIHFVINVSRVGSMDNMRITAELRPNVDVDLDELKKRIQKDMNSMLLVNSVLELVPPDTIARSEGKFKRVIDERK